jgi:chorismate mutase/prephenate dehydratase
MPLDHLRQEIDALDRQIIALLKDRAAVSRQIGQEKSSLGLPVYDPQREAQLLDSLTTGDLGLLDPEAVAAIYREIISASRALQRQASIAYLGPEYTFSHLAAVKQFGSCCQLLAQPTIDEVFRTVERGNADFGVVPIENAIQGVETRTLDSFIESPLPICGELFVDVHICLLASGDLGQVTRVHSHPQPLAQCHLWLRANLPLAETATAASTSSAAATVAAAQDPTQAALATAAAAEHHGLRILAENVEDQPNNRTRFFVIGQIAPERTGADKTSVLFTTRHKSGALYSALAPFSAHQINLTLIQSRPSPAKLEGPHIFYVDLEGHQQDLPVRQCLHELRELTQTLKVLGSYPQAHRPQPAQSPPPAPS